MGSLGFFHFVQSSIVNNPLRFFFNRSEKNDFVILKYIVYFSSISLVFSLNERPIKCCQLKISKVFFEDIIVCSLKNPKVFSTSFGKFLRLVLSNRVFKTVFTKRMIFNFVRSQKLRPSHSGQLDNLTT